MVFIFHGLCAMGEVANKRDQGMLDLKGMAPADGLDGFLAAAVEADAQLASVAEVVRAVAKAAIEIAAQIALGPLAGEAMPAGGRQNAGGDVQKTLDLLTDRLFTEALHGAPVAVLVSEELDVPKVLNEGAPLVVAIDPLDGSSNIETNVSVGTIFSILPAIAGAPDPAVHFKQPGANQLGAGFVVYGPQTLIVLAVGGPTASFILDPRTGRFALMNPSMAIEPDSHEYAINTSNYRHWDPAVRAFIDDAHLGEEGRLSRNHNMRWTASMVADAYRILVRGGVFLYPGDSRKGYNAGRLRLLYEVSPIAYLVEHAGGKATDGAKRILDVVADDVHQRSPLVFGSAQVVDTIAEYHTDPKLVHNRSPLFKSHGLIMG